MGQCTYTIFILMEFSGGKWVKKMNNWIQQVEDYLLNKIMKHKEKINSFEQIGSLEIKIQEQNSNSLQNGTHSNITVKSYDYSQDSNSYIISNNDKDYKKMAKEENLKPNEPKKEINSYVHYNKAITKVDNETQFYSFGHSASPLPPSLNNHNQKLHGNKILTTTDSSTLNERINNTDPTNNINPDRSKENEWFVNDILQKEQHNIKMINETSSSFSISSLPLGKIPPLSFTISPLTKSSQTSSSIQTPSLVSNSSIININDRNINSSNNNDNNTTTDNNNNNNNDNNDNNDNNKIKTMNNNNNNINNSGNNNNNNNNNIHNHSSTINSSSSNIKKTKISLFYKLFLFLCQMVYFSILILLVYRGIINYFDNKILYTIPGQITKINSQDKEYSLHIQCLGQGPVTILFESGLFISSYLLWQETYQRTSTFTKSCIYDRAGYGWSEMGSLPRTQEQEINELTELLNQSNLDGPFLLVSHSYGSLLSTSFAIHNKNKIKGMILVEPFFVTSNFNISNYLFYNFNNLKNTLYWSGFNSAISKDIFSISTIENNIGLPMDILSNNIEKQLIRNTKLFKTVYSEIENYNTLLNQNNESLNSLKELVYDIPIKIILGDQTINQNSCIEGVEGDECRIKNNHNINYFNLVNDFCEWDNCDIKIAENSGYYVPLERLDIIITMIYDFIQ
ncbi:hypothetical protein BCR36DRAFT_415823 [Piromyces finnis]|uniref:AB hydrolase-1 domain-containing protein n=1 Tax=Piromyces finnis TaxID=1754191 RepID=A0A1Y1UZ51_9FUNG|nr:hypothetical protein BCR36DRAFT_415823 [Piromyces finnis]|eukprot:ORX42975.1 hypothetical protein BCR36DRAFT_415823 [Piromyces finnis]